MSFADPVRVNNDALFSLGIVVEAGMTAPMTRQNKRLIKLEDKKMRCMLWLFTSAGAPSEAHNLAQTSQLRIQDHVIRHLIFYKTHHSWTQTTSRTTDNWLTLTGACHHGEDRQAAKHPQNCLSMKQTNLRCLGSRLKAWAMDKVWSTASEN